MKVLVISFYVFLICICFAYIGIPIDEQSDILKIAVCLPLGGFLCHAIDEIKEWWKL